jgi:hypothetical protein
MNRELLIEGVLIAVLAGYGGLLVTQVGAARLDAVRSTADANQRLLFADATGIDVLGERIHPARSPGRRGVVAFVLRSRSLGADLAFWREVADLASNVSSETRLEFVGYCDGAACADALKNRQHLGRLTVIAYGEAIDSQAVLNADEQGDFVVKDRDQPPRRVWWRDRGLRAADIARDLVR